MKKIIVMVALALFFSGAAESEPTPFPYADVEHEPAVSIWVSVLDPIPIPWDAYRVVDDELCHDGYAYCYFVPDVGTAEVYFVVGRYLHGVGARLVMESPMMQLWDLRPYLPNGEPIDVMFTSDFSDGTMVWISR